MVEGIGHSHSADHGLRRHRTGPDNSHYRGVSRFLKNQGYAKDWAANRAEWRQLEDLWVASWVPHVPSGDLQTRANVFQVEPCHWGVADKRAVQGFIHGSGCVFLVQGPDLLSWKVVVLARREGWQVWDCSLESYAGLSQLMHAGLQSVPGHVTATWAVIRMYFLHVSDHIMADFQTFHPYRSSFLAQKFCPAVLLYSRCPEAWVPLVTAAASTECLVVS
mgnify:CR=1 FL=1